MENLNAIAKRWETQGAGAIEKAESKKREEDLQAAIAQKTREDEEKERQRIEKKHLMEVRAAELNRKLVAEKELEKQRQREEGLRIRAEYQQQMMETKRLTEEAEMKRRRQMDETRQVLEGQMTERKQYGFHGSKYDPADVPSEDLNKVKIIIVLMVV